MGFRASTSCVDDVPPGLDDRVEGRWFRAEGVRDRESVCGGGGSGRAGVSGEEIGFRGRVQVLGILFNSLGSGV